MSQHRKLIMEKNTPATSTRNQTCDVNNWILASCQLLSITSRQRFDDAEYKEAHKDKHSDAILKILTKNQSLQGQKGWLAVEVPLGNTCYLL